MCPQILGWINKREEQHLLRVNFLDTYYKEVSRSEFKQVTHVDENFTKFELQNQVNMQMLVFFCSFFLHTKENFVGHVSFCNQF